MNKFMKVLHDTFWPAPQLKSDLEAARKILDRDPDLRKIRRDHRHLEARVSALEVQARVRARRH